MSTEFIRNLVEYSPIRTVASVRGITSPSVKYPKRTSITNAQWEGEAEDSGGAQANIASGDQVNATAQSKFRQTS